MDIDENTGQGPPPPSSQQQQQQQQSQPQPEQQLEQQPAVDIEQLLLHQFSRMGTTDHDELVGQLQKVLGNQLNYTTARFFLDMNNW